MTTANASRTLAEVVASYGTMKAAASRVWVEVVASINLAAQASLSDTFFTPTQSFFDLSVTANRRKLFSVSKGAVALGPQGSAVTGEPAAVFLHISGGGKAATADTFAANEGTGGSFTIEATG